jgi:hypothetical protein
MRTEREQRSIERRAVDTLEQSLDELDVTTRARLRAARLRALEATSSRLRWPNWITAAGFASAVSLSLFLTTGSLYTQNVQLTNPVQDIEILVEIESIDFYDDLEFLEWLHDSAPAG